MLAFAADVALAAITRHYQRHYETLSATKKGWQADGFASNPLNNMARPERLELPTLRFEA